MSEKIDSSELVHQHAGTSSSASEQELEVPLPQQEHIDPLILSNIQADDSIDNNATLAVGWRSSPIVENQADTVAADWSGTNNDPQDDTGPTVVASTNTAAEDWDDVPTTDDGSWDSETFSVPSPFSKSNNVLDKRFFLIDSVTKMSLFLSVLSNIQNSWRQELFCGCKGNGVGLSRDGAITFFTMTIRSLNTTYTFDVQVLGDQVFNMVGNNGLSLRMILESKEFGQVWWDVRNDFEALSHHYNIHPHFDIDLQLLDIMSTRGNRAKLNGLIASVRKNQAGDSRMNDLTMWRGYSGTWSTKKKEVKDYLDWNGFEALEIRPVHPIVILGCRIDTEILPELFDHLLRRLWETTNEMKMGSPELFYNIVREESWIRAQAVWSRESSNVYVSGICREIRNHPRTRSPPIFTMLPQVVAGIREDEFMIGFE
ncbi:uncharacterized protein EAF01_000108 [Botrytis porri]|uniref:uncharacterized protein n=1 Tax=Botrytis porri TaxID=87229 RepID=UPI0019017AED|nr:uncharacterized protein EAF01_000108 [Botrytis porri]KAF7913702.1 hypothetical protein EAF01_000108 [Botrytis porri]